MRTMKAVVIPRAEGDTIEFGRVPVPEIGPDELLVRVKAIGVGIHDSYFLPQRISYPYPIGIEGAGVVEEVGGSATGYAPGDRVAFVSALQVKGGTWAEYAAVRANSMIVPIPPGMSFEQAAAIPIAGNTAAQAFHSLPPLGAGAAVFIAGASGAIGTFAIQFARARGWEVAASASPANHNYLRSLGVALAVDYHDPGWQSAVLKWRSGGVDGALAIQPQTTVDSMGVVKDGGAVVTISGDQALPVRAITVRGLPQVNLIHELEDLMQHIAEGQVRLVIEHIYPFNEALAALAKVQTRHARGKIVISLGDVAS